MCIILHTFWGSGIQEQLSWVLLAQSLSLIRLQSSSWQGLQSPQGPAQLWLKNLLLHSFVWLLAGLCFSPLGPLCRLPLCPNYVAAGFLQSKWWERQTDRHRQTDGERGPWWNLWFFYNLISEVAYHRFCLMLFDPQSNPVSPWEGAPQGCGCQEAGVIEPSCGLATTMILAILKLLNLWFRT